MVQWFKRVFASLKWSEYLDQDESYYYARKAQDDG